MGGKNRVKVQGDIMKEWNGFRERNSKAILKEWNGFRE